MDIHTSGRNKMILVVLVMLVASACVVTRSKSTVSVQSVLATGVVFGKVLNRNKKPVGGVQLTLLLRKCRCEECPEKKKCGCCPLQESYTTAENGDFKFEVPPGTYLLAARRGDARAEREIPINAGQREQVDITLPID